MYGMKKIDRNYRNEYLIVRHLRVHNDKLMRRLNALDMISDGRLEVEDEVRDYLALNFTSEQHVNEMTTEITYGVSRSDVIAKSISGNTGSAVVSSSATLTASTTRASSKHPSPAGSFKYDKQPVGTCCYAPTCLISGPRSGVYDMSMFLH